MIACLEKFRYYLHLNPDGPIVRGKAHKNEYLDFETHTFPNHRFQQTHQGLN